MTLTVYKVTYRLFRPAYRGIIYSGEVPLISSLMMCVCFRRIQLLESELIVLNDWQVKRDYNRK